MTLRKIPGTALLIASIVVVFLVQFSIDRAGAGSVAIMGGLTSETLSKGEYWRLFAAMFLHFGALHALLNLWTLYQVGGVFEVLFGTRRLLLVYLLCGLSSSLASASFMNANTLGAGASGAIFGVIGAVIVGLRRSPRWRGQPWARGLFQQLVGWSIFMIVAGFAVEWIDNSAHLGGFVAGLALGLIPHRVPPPAPRDSVIEATAIE